MGKIVLLTGGSSGIGLQTALALHRAGCTVYEMSRKPAQNEGIIHLHGDVTKEDTVLAAVEAVLAREGRISDIRIKMTLPQKKSATHIE